MQPSSGRNTAAAYRTLQRYINAAIGPRISEQTSEANPIPWSDWLTSQCELRGEAPGVTWYGITNCNYLVVRGRVLTCYGYHGEVMFKALARGSGQRRRTLLKRARQMRELVEVARGPSDGQYAGWIGRANRILRETSTW